jgi:hypothetical protein
MIQARCRPLRIHRLEALAFEQILTEPGGNSDPDARVQNEPKFATTVSRDSIQTNPIQPATGHCLVQNEPNPTGHQPLTNGRCVQNEPNSRPASAAARAPNEAAA